MDYTYPFSCSSNQSFDAHWLKIFLIYMRWFQYRLMQLNNLIDFEELQFMSANEASWQLSLPIASIKIEGYWC